MTRRTDRRTQMSTDTAEITARTTAEAGLVTTLALGGRILSASGHDDFNQGQISGRLPRRKHFFIKQALCGFDEASPAGFVTCAISEPGPPLAPPELPLHQAVFAARPDVTCIVHSHAPHTLAFGALDLELRPLSHDGAVFAGRLPRFTATSNTVLDLATGMAIAGVLGDAPAVLLRNHGGVIVGRSVREAVIRAQLLERACMLQLLTSATGQQAHYSSAADVAAKQDFIFSSSAIKTYFDHQVRALRRLAPETAAW
jgi:L-fuculose-phosphate aldolase